MPRSSRNSASSAKKRPSKKKAATKKKVVASSSASATSHEEYAHNQRIAIFVDVQNLYHSVKHKFRGNGRVNYKILMDTLTGDRQLVRALAYTVRSENVLAEREERDKNPKKKTTKKAAKNKETEEEYSGEEAFFMALEEAGLEMQIKDLQVFADGSKKADWDVGIAIDAIRMADAFDVIVLVSGDGDFVPLVNYLQWGLGKYVEVAAFQSSISSNLKDAADHFIDLSSVNKMVTRTRRRS